MNEHAFYAELRRSVFRNGGISQGQVEGISSILRSARRRNIEDGRHVANILAQVHHETGGQMLPVKETVFASSTVRNPTDAEVIRRLDAAFAKRKLPWVKLPYWREGWFGRGQIQVTHADGYRRVGRAIGVDLIADRARALDLDVSADIAVVGMRDGIFTGKRLADYLNDARDDPAGARAIVNGDGKAVGPKIAAAHRDFLAAIEAGGGWTPLADPGTDPDTPTNNIEERLSRLEAEVAAMMTMIGGGR